MICSQSVIVGDFESAAMPHFKALYRTAVHVTQNQTEAEDLVQQAYLQAWKAFDRFEPGTNCRAWLFRILFNVIRHHRRSWFSKHVVQSGEAFEDNLVAEPSLPDQLTDQDILAALDQVPPRFREVLLLVDVQEFTYKEVSETLKVPIGTVMSRVSRGREFLRTELLRQSGSAGATRRNVQKCMVETFSSSASA
jgi:RNA polymerase sigma-70 factor (ECF subfamily)